MAEFIITTTDDALTYTDTAGAQIIFDAETNTVTSNTQGFLSKVQKGRVRNKATVSMLVTNTDYENIFLPMLEYPTAVNCTFDREIPMRGTATGEFNLLSARIVAELPDSTYDLELELVEIIVV